MKRKLVLLLLCLVMCVSVLTLQIGQGIVSEAASSIYEDKQHLAQLEEKLKNLKNNQSILKDEINSAQGQLQTLLSQKIQLEQQITYLNDEISLTQTLVDEYNDVIRSSEEKTLQLERELQRELDDFGTVVEYLYKNGDASALELLISAENFGDYLAMVDFTTHILEYNDKMISGINSTIDAMAVTKEQYVDAQAKLETYGASLEISRMEQLNKTAELDTLIESSSSGLQYTQQEIDGYSKLEDEIRKEIEELQKQIEEKLAYSDSEFSWPFSSNTKYRISSRFGIRTDGPFTDYEHHNGLDLVASRGTPIHAVAGGVVTYSGMRGSFGNVVFIAHANGLTTIYAHCDSLLVSTGATVLQDQVIAKVGTTGMSSGYHLHFAVTKDGSYVDPAKYLPKSYLD